jgi:hypothetical protein
VTLTEILVHFDLCVQVSRWALVDFFHYKTVQFACIVGAKGPRRCFFGVKSLIPVLIFYLLFKLIFITILDIIIIIVFIVDSFLRINDDVAAITY